MILNKALCFWLIPKFDHHQVFSFSYCHRISAHSSFISSTHLFFTPVTRRQKREWMSNQCQKSRPKVKESFFKLVNLLPIYIYIYMCTLYHVVILSHQQSYLVYKLVSIIDLSFAWYCVFSLIFTIQHILTIFFLSEFSFESFIVLFVPSYCHISELKSCSPESLHKAQFIKFFKRPSIYRYLSVVLKKNSSVTDLIDLFCLSKCFGRNKWRWFLSRRQPWTRTNEDRYWHQIPQ